MGFSTRFTQLLISSLHRRNARSGFRAVTCQFLRYCSTTPSSSTPSISSLSNANASTQKSLKVTKDLIVDLKSTNPMYSKYADKIKNKIGDSDAAIQKRLEEGKEKFFREEKLPLSELVHKTGTVKRKDRAKMNNVKELNDILDVEKVRELPVEKITDLWKLYFQNKNKVFGTIATDKYNLLRERAERNKLMVFPVPKPHGKETYFVEYKDDNFFATNLLEYKTHNENARVALTVTHYLEFAKDKEIVLMLGDPDTDRLSVFEAQTILNMISIFYQDDLRFKNYVETFNQRPNEFDFNALAAECQM